MSKAKPLDALRALVVEDEPLVAREIASNLTEAGATTVAICTNDAAALTALRTQIIHFAVVDFRLGEAASVGVQVELERRAIPYLLLTGYPPLAVRRSKAQVILAKPADERVLIKAILQLLEGSAAKKRLQS
jgi:ActR/RegA family two-component response regulator